jgi:choline dehydrogenase-like flavoprotein
MIVDACQLPEQYAIKCDICIVGAGAAGITVAHELLGSGKTVVLLESGGTRLEPRIQDLYKGQVVDPSKHGRLDLYRQRRFGGTTAVWGGRCAPFDDIDFEGRPYVPYSGWPIRKADLDPYYSRAHAYCDLGAYEYDALTALPHSPIEMIPGFRSGDVRTNRLWRFSLPTNFAKTFGGTLRKSKDVTVYLHANCLRIRAHRNGTAVDHLECASSPARKFTVRANQYVLAAGGLEVTRLLLASDDVHAQGLGNSRDLVGRFYLSHLTGDLGEVHFVPKGGPVVWNYERTPDRVYCRRSISVAEERQRSDQLLNFRATLSHSPIEDPGHGNGVLSSMYLIKKYLVRRIPPEYSRSLSGMAPVQRAFEHLGNIMKDSPNVMRFSSAWIRQRILPKRKLPSVVFESKANKYTLHFDSEQSPNIDSRVKLSNSTDIFGIRRLTVDWRFANLDVQSVVRSCQLISKAFERSDIGRMTFRPEWMADQIGASCSVGSHHIGTTRMASSPVQGVVDEDCRVHGIANLYIASSSVFPTSGIANPTLTIVALAIRLANKLRSQRQLESELILLPETSGVGVEKLFTAKNAQVNRRRATSGQIQGHFVGKFASVFPKFFQRF